MQALDLLSGRRVLIFFTDQDAIFYPGLDDLARLALGLVRGVLGDKFQHLLVPLFGSVEGYQLFSETRFLVFIVLSFLEVINVLKTPRST